jgi:hypothetical protein
MSRTLPLLVTLVLIAAASKRLLAQPRLRITSPQDRAVVRPGGKVEVTVSTSGGTFLGVGVIPHDPIALVAGLASPPYQFSIAIPMKIRLGLYTLTAMGRTESAGDPLFSDPVSIDVERPDSPGSITTNIPVVEGPVGGQMNVRVTGTYGDGSTENLSSSTRTIYVSQVTSIATVDADGYITGIAPGSTSIVIRHEDHRIVVKVVIDRAQP